LRSLTATWRLTIPARSTSNASDTAAHRATSYAAAWQKRSARHSCIADTAHVGRVTLYVQLPERVLPGAHTNAPTMLKFGICSPAQPLPGRLEPLHAMQCARHTPPGA
jgi:hypothetical protein